MLKIYVFLNKIFGIFKYTHDTCRHVHIQFFLGGGGCIFSTSRIIDEILIRISLRCMRYCEALENHCYPIRTSRMVPDLI